MWLPVKLITKMRRPDDEGIKKNAEVWSKEVLADKTSVKRAEYGALMKIGIEPTAMFDLYHHEFEAAFVVICDEDGQKRCYEPTELDAEGIRYAIHRSHHDESSDMVSLTCSKIM